MSSELQELARKRYVPRVFGYAAVAKELGVSTTTIQRWVKPELAERMKLRSAQAKRRRTGTCEKCGAPTRYRGAKTPGAVSRFCIPCGQAWSAARKRELRGTGPMEQRFLALFAENALLRYIEIREHLGISHGYTGNLLHRMLKYGFITREQRGVYILSAKGRRVLQRKEGCNGQEDDPRL